MTAIDTQALRTMWSDGDTVTAIGAALGCSPQDVSRHAAKLGLPRRMIVQGSLPAAAIEACYRDGQSLDEIREALLPKFPTVARTTLRRLLENRGVIIRSKGGPLRVSPETCLALAGRGLAPKAIAKRLGLSRRQVCYRLAKKLGPVPRGAQNERRFDYAEIQRLRRKEGMAWKEIAAVVGCSLQTIGTALNDG